MEKTSRAAGRLATVSDLVPPGSGVADVGTGHGGLVMSLLTTGRATHCVAIERRPDLAAPHLHRRSRREPRLQLRFGDGLSPLRLADRVDVAVLAGLGTRTMIRILGGEGPAALGIRRLVLQPQSEPARLRRWLVESGHRIVGERMAHERGRFYCVLAAELGSAKALPQHEALGLDDLLAAGPCLVRSDDPLVRSYWRATLGRHERILARGGLGTAREARAQALRILDALPRVQWRSPLL